MILDMHFHTQEGSIDGKIGVMDGLKILKQKGYDGVLITDHNSYNGFNSIKENIPDLTVFCGIEYDSIDGGHSLIILPDGLQLKALTVPGMKISSVIDMVHSVGGVIGFSHPHDCCKLGFMNHKYDDIEDILRRVDFIEGVNASSFKIKNEKAIELARKNNKPCTAGSDSHKEDEVGKGRVEIPFKMKTNNDLIKVIKEANFNTFTTKMSFRKPSVFEPILQFRVNLGGFCWYRYFQFIRFLRRE